MQATTIGARATIDVSWQVPGYGPWHYASAIPLRQRRTAPGRSVWSPKIISPKLSADTRLGTERDEPKRAPILDRTGTEILGDRPVVDVGLERDKVTNVTASATALAKLVGIDGATLSAQVKGAGPKEFVVAVTLRTSDYKPIAAHGSAGSRAATGIHTTLPIAPTHAFGRALLGAIGLATAEQIKTSKRALVAGDYVGQWGLEQQYDRHLAGSASYSIITRDRVTGDADRHARHPSGPRTRDAAHDDLDAGAERRREGARLVDRAVGDRRRAALDRRHARRREPARPRTPSIARSRAPTRRARRSR